MKLMGLLKGKKANKKKFKEIGIFSALVLLCLVIALANSAFYSADNLINLLRQTSYVVIIAIFTTMVIIIGGLDLSVGSVIGLSGIVVAIFLQLGVPIYLSIIFALLAVAIIGALNGVLIVLVQIPSLIVTLGTLYIARGICNGITKGVPVYPLPDAFSVIGNGTLFSIPYSVYFVILVAVILSYVLNNTTFGRSIYAIGGNEETARLSGIRVKKIKIIVYILSSISAAIAGVIMTSRIESAQTSLGTGWELTVISSAVIGGTSMLGGSGTVLGAVLGATLMSVISNGMIIMNVSVYWQSIAIGAIIILAVAIDLIGKRRAGLDTK
jgi:ribose transport system permease protein